MDIKKIITAVVFPVWVIATAPAADLSYGTKDAPISSQTQTIGAGSTIDSITAWINPGETLTLDGGSFTFSAGAAVKSSMGRIVFDAKPTLAGDISFGSTGDGVREYGSKDDADALSWTTENPTEVLTGCLVEDWEPIKGYSKGPNEGDQEPYNVKRGEGWVEAQFQIRAKTNSALKCVKIRFSQVGNNVVAYIVYGRYRSYRAEDPTWNAIGHDFDEGEYDGSYYPTDRNLVKFTYVKFKCVAQREWAFKKSVDGTARMTAFPGERNIVTLEGKSIPDADGEIKTAFRAGEEGVIRLLDIPLVTLKGYLSGANGSLEVIRTTSGEQNEDQPIGEYEINISDYETLNAYMNWTLVARGSLLKDLMTIDAKIAGKGLGTGCEAFVPPASGHIGVFYFRNNGGAASAQVQYHPNGVGGASGTVKSVLIELRQGADGVEIRIAKSSYMTKWVDDGNGFDFLGLPYNYSWGGLETGPTKNGYTCPYVKLTFSGSCLPWYRNIYGAGIAKSNYTSGDYQMVDGTYSVCGAPNHPIFLGVTNNYAGPYNGMVHVHSNGIFQSATDGAKNSLQYGATIEADGMMFLSEGTPGFVSPLVVYGGTLMIAPEKATAPNLDYEDATGYVGELVLSNGAVVAGWGFRCGYGSSIMKIMAGGSKPSVIDTPITFCSQGQYTMSDIDFVVDNTAEKNATNDDLLVSGDIRVYNPSKYDYVRMLKHGNGVLRMNGSYSPTNEIVVYEGTVKLGKCEVLGVDSKVRLAGGILNAAESTTNDCGYVALSDDSELVIKRNAKVSVNQLFDWTAGKVLKVALDEGAAFRIGTSKCLSRAQLKCIKVNGRRNAAEQDEQGYIHMPPKPGILMTVR